MEKEQVLLDAEVFSRTASLFEMKRNSFAPEAVEVLASDIVRRLARGASLGTTYDIPTISRESIAKFCDALVQPESEAALRYMLERREEGVTRQGVYLGYITAAACYLGEMWDQDRMTFLEVTTGTGHLYALMRALRDERPAIPLAFDAARCALFATVPGEDHGIGITVAADLFRDAGWDIDLQTGTEHDQLVARVERTQPHVIGLSLSTDHRLDAFVRLVVAIRIVVPSAIIGVAPSSMVDAKRLKKLADIDLIFTDAPSAYRELDRLVRKQD